MADENQHNDDNPRGAANGNQHNDDNPLAANGNGNQPHTSPYNRFRATQIRRNEVIAHAHLSELLSALTAQTLENSALVAQNLENSPRGGCILIKPNGVPPASINKSDDVDEKETSEDHKPADEKDSFEELHDYAMIDKPATKVTMLDAEALTEGLKELDEADEGDDNKPPSIANKGPDALEKAMRLCRDNNLPMLMPPEILELVKKDVEPPLQQAPVDLMSLSKSELISYYESRISKLEAELRNYRDGHQRLFNHFRDFQNDIFEKKSETKK